jgi:hypothetical protein
VNLKDFFEFEIFGGEIHSVLGLDGLEARTVGIGARKGRQISMELTVCQVVNDKAFISSEMRNPCSNRVHSLTVRPWKWRSKAALKPVSTTADLSSGALSA